VWWHTSAIPALEKLRQEDHEFQVSLRYIARFYLQEAEKRVGQNGPF
jgi:hypothetical protein